MATYSIALPGQLLGPANKYRPGPGVHLHEANLYSSLLGAVTVSQPPSSSTTSTSSTPAIKGPPKRQNKLSAALQQQQQQSHGGGAQLPTISVSRRAAGGRRQREVLPQVGNSVLCRVTRITPRQAVVAILVCGETVLEAEWQGVIRVQDVRATEKDRVKIYESFRPGDIVRASVVCISVLLSLCLSHAPSYLLKGHCQANQVDGTCADGLVYRSHSATRPTTIFPRRATSLASSWRSARRATLCTRCLGKSTRTRRRG